jgi:hypothetical protein
MSVTINGSGTITGATTLATTVASPTFTTPNIDSAQFATISGTAPLYACRAWVNFNGTGTVAIRASGNVTSITDNGEGDYTVNFTTAMPDTNYCVSLGQVSSTVANDSAIASFGILVSSALGSAANTKTTTAIRLFQRYLTATATGIFDANECNVSIFR